MKSHLTLKTMLCADVIQIAADFAGEDEQRCTALEELADKGLSATTRNAVVKLLVDE